MNEEGLTKNIHNKIFVARPGSFNLNEVKENIKELIKSVFYRRYSKN